MKKAILTCAVTGSAPMTARHTNVPVTPRQIADQAVDAARAGAAIVHLHVRDPETGAPSMKLELYREVVERIRGSGVDVILNLTTGPGASFVPGAENPAVAGAGTTLCQPEHRIRHVLELRPEICTLDLNTMWFNTRAAINIPAHVAEMARAVQGIGVLPELEVFDTGDIQLAHHLIQEGSLKGPTLFQIVLGIRFGAISTPASMMHMRHLLPDDAAWAAFGISAQEYPMLAQALLLGGHVRVGLEDNLYLERGVLAPNNAALVDKAVQLMRMLGTEPATPSEARKILNLRA
ncbi:3-keto-5-aminohexanoate cleavage protein [Pseudoroseomonas globiformis]|uniref:3-keto-5-aminohexanoate cleavage protein n=1 Tax=Teichococcus globiformis TaxID=2307229 RepID=A0ABV7G3Y4_9PROT